MTTLQTSLLLKPPFFHPLTSYKHPLFTSQSYSFPSNRKLKLCSCTLQSNPLNSNPTPESENPTSNSTVFEGKSGNSPLSELESTGTQVGNDDNKVVEGKGSDGRLAIVAFFIGVWVATKKRLEKIWLSGWLSWWPWQQEKRLEKLVVEADANPNDAALQSSLLVELNKHKYDSKF